MVSSTTDLFEFSGATVRFLFLEGRLGMSAADLKIFLKFPVFLRS